MTVDIETMNVPELSKASEYVKRQCKTTEILTGDIDLDKIDKTAVHDMSFYFGMARAIDISDIPEDELRNITDETTRDFIKEVIEPSAKLYNDFMEKNKEYVGTSIMNSCYVANPLSWAKRKQIEHTVRNLLK